LATAQLVIWSPKLSEALDCPLDETTWLDRHLLSAGTDPTLHRSPRCAGVRYMDHGWELFSHDISHEVHIGPYADGAGPHYETVRASAVHVLSVARGKFRPYPVRLDNGSWLVSVGKWVVRLEVSGSGAACAEAGPAGADKTTATHERRSRRSDSPGRGSAPLPGAAARVELAAATAAANERSGKSKAARARFRYRQKNRRDPAAISQG